MKLARPANLSPQSRVHTIFLPSSTHIQINPSRTPTTVVSGNNDLFDRNENFLRALEPSTNHLSDLIAQVNQWEMKKRQRSKLRSSDGVVNSTKVTKTKRNRRRNDKFLHRRPTNPNDEYLMNPVKFASSSIDYYDCVAVGWGKFRNSNDLSDALLKIEVPIQPIKR
jgi:hypothetical protein